MYFRQDIQGLRALAFLFVFVFHLNSLWLPGGFLGVDVFFVISGYLMTTLIIDDITKEKFSFKVFFLKRFKRIIPAYYFCLLAVAFAVSYYYLYSDLDSFKNILFRSALFISNRSFASGNTYFGAQQSENPLLHTWSLAIEMQFYVLLPFLLYFFKKHIVKITLSIIFILTIYSSYQIEILGNKNGMYFSLLARIPEFLIGSLFSQFFKNGIDLRRNINNLIATLSLFILIASAFFISEKTFFPGITAIVPCTAIAFLLCIKNNFVSDCFSKRIPVFIGGLSYSLYLWHFPIMALIRYTNDDYSFTFKEIIFICVLTFLLAWFSYNFIERKFRNKSDLSFYKIFIPLYITFGILTLSLPTILKFREIPNIYCKPIVGLNSHGMNNIEKFGSPIKNDKIALIGNSHALALKPFFDYIGKSNNFSFYTLTCDSYLAIKGIDKNEIPVSDLKYYKSGRKLINKTYDLIQNSNVIIIANLTFQRTQSQYKAIDDLCNQIDRDKKIILINTFPIIDKNPIKINNGYVKNSNYKFKEIENNENYNKLKKIADKYDNVYLYNINKGIIRKNLGYINDTVAYYNSEHINTFASVKMAKDLNQDFMSFFNKIRNKK
ncbi:acyltransferase family protein [Flavobacterium sp. JAS]|uniref:acyltransferase family protein n=1 Tax=Flavobacterium sp. JAS TaxID=2897329 RepID=UPI001E39A746|nr:acyltransferase family protein [Flavobacterium sp. JAS]MCD0469788.1 acyltransferase [Flavobacterium sp. JAS]